MAGFTIAADQPVVLTVAGQTFALFAKDDAAWLQDPTQSDNLAGVMRAGTTAVIDMTSDKGIKIKETFSLAGATAASKAVNSSCSVAQPCSPAAASPAAALPIPAPCAKATHFSSPRCPLPPPQDAMTIALDLSTPPAVRPAVPDKRPLVGLSKPELAAALVEGGIPERDAKMRASQVWNWIYHHGVTDFERMTKCRRASASSWRRISSSSGRKSFPSRSPPTAPASGCSAFAIRPTRVCRRSRSRRSTFPSTIAAPSASRSQVGCTLTCSFCHTGTQRLVRNLTAGEILGQILMARERLGDFPGGSRPADGGLVPAPRGSGGSEGDPAPSPTW